MTETRCIVEIRHGLGRKLTDFGDQVDDRRIRGMAEENGGGRQGTRIGGLIRTSEHHMDAGRQHAVDTGKGVGQLLRDGVGHASLFLRGG